ncbi:hypothetical protein M885DRAFT_510624 [Pelagophyceae sp. CCMP2097]|nr:hypothetical protein M885DRAFT_510624 [Pelagophyceae sp. CCMP2097]
MDDARKRSNEMFIAGDFDSRASFSAPFCVASMAPLASSVASARSRTVSAPRSPAPGENACSMLLLRSRVLRLYICASRCAFGDALPYASSSGIHATDAGLSSSRSEPKWPTPRSEQIESCRFRMPSQVGSFTEPSSIDAIAAARARERKGAGPPL